MLIQLNNIAFGYHSPMMREFKKGKIPLKCGAYGGKITSKNASHEHIIPHSKGGPDTQSNYLLTTKELNEARGCEPFIKHVNWIALLEYFSVMLRTKTDKFDGVEYTKGAITNILKAIKHGY